MQEIVIGIEHYKGHQVMDRSTRVRKHDSLYFASRGIAGQMLRDSCDTGRLAPVHDYQLSNF